MHVHVFVPTALKPHPMLQSVVQGAPVFASALVQLMSVDEPPPPAPVVAVPAEPEPPVPDISPPPLVVVVDEDVPAAPDVTVDDSVPPEPVAADVPDDVPPDPLTGEVPVPLSVLLEQPKGTQR